MTFMLGDKILDFTGNGRRKTVSTDEMRSQLIFGGSGAGIAGGDSVGDSHDEGVHREGTEWRRED